MTDKKRVIMLGAGASRELRFFTRTLNSGGGGFPDETKRFHCLSGPLSAGFLYDANEFSKETKKFSHFPAEFKIRNEWLEKFVATRASVRFEQLFIDPQVSKKVNIEKIYSNIEKEIEQKENRANILSFAEIWQGQRALFEYIFHVLSVICYHSFSLFHRVLAHYVIQHQIPVISFNWDILFEEELYRTEYWNYQDGYGGFSPRGIFDKEKQKCLPILNLERYSNNFVLKPHGSINWYSHDQKNREYDYESGEIYVATQLPDNLRGGTMGWLQSREYDWQNNAAYEALLLPPGRKRKRFGFIWQKIKETLKEADEVMAIGLSMNSFDHHVMEEFKEIVFKKDLIVKLISPDSGLEAHYGKVFQNAKIDREFKLFSEYCRWLIKRPGMEKFAQIEEELFAAL